jgi:diguanylate cyclase (GGDEF)-like protein
LKTDTSSTALSNATVIGSVQDPTNGILDAMEQGVLVWSADGICEMHNKRVFDVLEITSGQLYPGLTRGSFLKMAVGRGEFDQDTADRAEQNYRDASPFSFERRLPSGRTIVTNARPRVPSGFVVTFTDVTHLHDKGVELESQRELSHEAEARATEALRLMRARERDSRQMSQLGEWLQSCKSLEELLDILSQFLARLFVGSSGELFIFSNSRDVLDSACTWNHTPARANIEPDDCWALRRGRMYTYGQDLIDVTCRHAEDIADSETCYICIPIIAHGDTVGMLHIRFAQNDSEGQSARTVEDRRDLVIRCSEQISLAVANVRLRDELRDQSVRDPLTGLYNRRYFLDRCRRAISHAERYGNPVGIVSLDADHFKAFNDNHGHDAGDQVLRAIAGLMTETFDEKDTVARFGGEEFSILVPDLSIEAIRDRAETLRAAIECHTIRYGSGTLPPITVSIGIATYPEAGRSPQDLLRVADGALYIAKKKGRNRVVAFEQD